MPNTLSTANILQLLTVISQAASMVGASGAVPKYLTLAVDIIKHSTEAYNDLAALTNTVKRMVDENREPTPEEWAALTSRSDTAHAAIQGYDIDAEQ